ncbi:MAG: trypsin-like peptidase domain-containing protein [Saprospiraceae bacterium]|nr:trypsin-like peptidase domain-containing protein [Saprospiraceae bacterium]
MAKKKSSPKPVQYSSVARRRRLPPKGEREKATITMLDVSVKNLQSTCVIQKDGRLRVTAEVDANGWKHDRYPEIPTDALRARDVDAKIRQTVIKGYRPGGTPTYFEPKKARRTHRLPIEKGKDVDRGGTIFGTDNRYLFNDTSFPWRCTGKVRTTGQWGSGVTIGSRLVLTASHVVNWTGGAGGGVAGLTFTPAYFDGSGPWGTISATRVIYWLRAPGSLTDAQTAFDYCILVLADRIGDIVGYPGYRTYHDAWNGGSYWQSIGYPGELSSGERPAFQGGGVISSVQDFGMSGQTGFVLGHFNDFTPGQSGGPVWGWWGSEPWPRVVGVGSTIGSTAVVPPHGSTTGDNEYGGGPALSTLISWARTNYP